MAEQLFQDALGLRRPPDKHGAAIMLRAHPRLQPGLGETVHQFHCAVMADGEVLGEFPDRQRLAVLVAANGEDGLMLLCREAARPRRASLNARNLRSARRNAARAA